jgi:hypothetical protein
MAECLPSVSGASSDHLLRFPRQALVARLEHTLFRLTPMPYKHGLEIGITTRLFRRGCRGRELDGGGTAKTTDATALVPPVRARSGPNGHRPSRRTRHGESKDQN